jgi:hypothetical protein
MGEHNAPPLTDVDLSLSETGTLSNEEKSHAKAQRFGWGDANIR